LRMRLSLCFRTSTSGERCTRTSASQSRRVWGGMWGGQSCAQLGFSSTADNFVCPGFSPQTPKLNPDRREQRILRVDEPVGQCRLHLMPRLRRAGIVVQVVQLVRILAQVVQLTVARVQVMDQLPVLGA